MHSPHISVVSPVYNSSGCLAELCQRISKAVSEITTHFEIILVDDRSQDDGWKKIRELAERDPRIVGFRLAKNFGQHYAISAAMDKAKGDWVVVMDCDLQDPPEMIPALYEEAQKGFHIVNAVFVSREETWFQQWSSKCFWRVLSWLSGCPFDYRVCNFSILSRKAADSYRCYRENHRLFGGIKNLMGFTVSTVPMRRDKRFLGVSQYSLRGRFRLAKVILAYSNKPLLASVYIGIGITLLALIGGCDVAYNYFVGRVSVSGWTSMMVSLCFFSGAILSSLGVLGVYIGKIFDETKKRPLYIIEDTVRAAVSPVAVKRDQLSQHRLIWLVGPSEATATVSDQLRSQIEQNNRAVIQFDEATLNALFQAESNQHEKLFAYAKFALELRQRGLSVILSTVFLTAELRAWLDQNVSEAVQVYDTLGDDDMTRLMPALSSSI